MLDPQEHGQGLLGGPAALLHLTCVMKQAHAQSVSRPHMCSIAPAHAQRQRQRQRTGAQAAAGQRQLTGAAAETAHRGTGTCSSAESWAGGADPLEASFESFVLYKRNRKGKKLSLVKLLVLTHRHLKGTGAQGHRG